MNDRIKPLIEQLNALDKRLHEEYEHLKETYSFTVEKNRITFLPNVSELHKKLRIPLWDYITPINLRYAISMPFIYMMIIPAVILDVFLVVYQAVTFPIYGIPKVQRSEYIIFDRRFLSYLNILQKINCLYCSYVNGLFEYAVEIASRTERFWCPIKAAQRPSHYHGWYKDFADYGNPDEWNERFNDSHAFDSLAATKETAE